MPFLDRQFMEVAMSIAPKHKRRMAGRIEKKILREAFNDIDNPYLPAEILWRSKEDFG